MHRQDGIADIDCADANLGKERANGGSAQPVNAHISDHSIEALEYDNHPHVIPDFVLLDLAPSPAHKLLDDERPSCACGIALLRTALDHDAAVHLRLMVHLVLFGVAGVQRVHCIRRDDE